MENEKPKRLVSIDALRGFDMFWIIGGDAIASEIGKLSHSPTVSAVTEQFSEHMEWAGFRFYDMIFPLFLFLIGCSIPFALGRRLEAGEGRRVLTKKVLIRFVILVIFGLIYNGLLKIPDWDHLRIFGVLQRQAFGYCMAALLFIYTKPRTQAIVFVSILLGYWAALALIPVPGYPRGSMSEWGSLASYVDRLVLQPGQMYEKYGDPEGLLSMIPSICTALLGVFAGRWLQSEEPDRRKVMGLVSAGLVSLALGVLWSPLFPVIKKIWTSSYVLVAGGFSLLLMALFYWMVDVRGWRKMVFPFVVIGMNAITIYAQFDRRLRGNRRVLSTRNAGPHPRLEASRHGDGRSHRAVAAAVFLVSAEGFSKGVGSGISGCAQRAVVGCLFPTGSVSLPPLVPHWGEGSMPLATSRQGLQKALDP